MALQDIEAPGQPRTIRIIRWLNVPRHPPFDRWGVPRGPVKVTREHYRHKVQNVFDFTMPATYWFLGKRYVGKSTGAEDVGIEYIECVNEESVGGTVIDFYSSDDDEAATWIKSKYRPIMLVCGNKINLEGVEKYPEVEWCHIGELKYGTPEQLEATIKRLEGFKVVVTVPGFFYNPNEMFRALSDMIEILKRRGRTQWKVNGRRKIFCLLVREGKILLASRYWAGAVQSRQDAEYDLIDLNDGAYHRGVAIAFDALRFMSITPEVRDIADFTFIKRLGRTKIPREFNYILRYTRPSYLRRMPKGAFVLYTDSDDIYAGVNAPVKWHVERGEAPLRTLGIRPVPNEDAKRPDTPEGATKQTVIEEATEANAPQNAKWKVGLELHRRIVNAVINEGLSYAKAQAKIAEGRDARPDGTHYPGVKLSVATLHNEIKAHKDGFCIEVVSGAKVQDNDSQK